MALEESQRPHSSAMRMSVQTASRAASILCAALLALAATGAAATPGTPIPLNAGQSSYSLSEPPRVGVSFRNTASEKVRFHMEWTANGQRMPFPAEQVSCRGFRSTGMYCASGHLFGPTGQFLEHKRDYPYEMVIKGLAFDTQYCFRFIAEDESGVRSKLWSGWVCGRTDSAPPVPAAVGQLQLTPIAGTSGRGEVGGSTPDRLLVEWRAPGTESNIAWYAIETARIAQQPAFVEDGLLRVKPSRQAGYEAVYDRAIDPNNPILIRVCSVNISGRSCSAHKRFPPRPVEIDAKPRLPQHDVKLDERAGSTPQSSPPAAAKPAAIQTGSTAASGAHATPTAPSAASTGPATPKRSTGMPPAAPAQSGPAAPSALQSTKDTSAVPPKGPTPPGSLDVPSGLRPRP